MSRPVIFFLATCLTCGVGCDDDEPTPTQAADAPAVAPATPGDGNAILGDGQRPAATSPSDAGITRSSAWHRINDLLAAGTDPNSADPLGVPLLHDAILQSANDAVELLIARGADVNRADPHVGWTALHHAASLGDATLSRLLIANGARVDSVDQRGRTPAHVAAENADPDVLELLLQHGASLAATDHVGATPLHAAVRADQPATVAWLLNHGAPLDARDAAGRTPLDLANLLGRQSLRELFVAAGKKRGGG